MMLDLQCLLNKPVQIVHAILSQRSNQESNSIPQIYNTTPSFAFTQPMCQLWTEKSLFQRVYPSNIHTPRIFLPFFRITHHGFTIFPSLPCSVFPSSTFVGGHPNVPGEHLLPGLKASEYLGVSTVCQLGGFSNVGSFGFFQR